MLQAAGDGRELKSRCTEKWQLQQGLQEIPMPGIGGDQTSQRRGQRGSEEPCRGSEVHDRWGSEELAERLAAAAARAV